MLAEFKQFITNLDNEIELPYGTVSLWFDDEYIHLRQTINYDDTHYYETHILRTHTDEDIKNLLTELCKDARDHLEFMQRQYIKQIEIQIEDITPILVECWSTI